MEWIGSSHPLAAVTQRERYSLYPILRRKSLRQASSQSSPLMTRISLWPGAHFFEPEGEREADDGRARDRVKARAEVTGLVLECAEQVGKAESAQVGEKVSEARQRPHKPGAVPFQRQSEDRSEVKLHEHGVDHDQCDQQRAPTDRDQCGGGHGQDD